MQVLDVTFFSDLRGANAKCYMPKLQHYFDASMVSIILVMHWLSKTVLINLYGSLIRLKNTR